MSQRPALPDGLGYDGQGRLCLSRLVVSDIAAQLATPFYLYDLDIVRARVKKLRQALAPLEPRICYAVKANGSLSLLKLLAQENLGADIVSGGELARALAAGFAPANIIFAGVGKTDAEILASLKAGIGQFNVESEAELERIAHCANSLGVTAPVALRINPDVDAGTHSKITTGRATDKFGLAPEAALALVRQRQRWPQIRIEALAFHLGSQLLDARPYATASIRLRELVLAVRAEGLPLRAVDLGGGFGVAQAQAAPFDFATYVQAVSSQLKPLELEITVEPGRYLVAEAGLLVTRVIQTKETAARRFVIIDAGMNDLLRPALYSAEHPVFPLVLDAQEDWQPADLVGPICESSDLFNRALALPRLAQGDVLALGMAGAYGAVMRSSYNDRALAAEVVAEGDRWAIATPALGPEALLAREQLAPWLAH
jgi:diaminopimelate decarboxylase